MVLSKSGVINFNLLAAISSTRLLSILKCPPLFYLGQF
jgi:hypothetical protein